METSGKVDAEMRKENEAVGAEKGFGLSCFEREKMGRGRSALSWVSRNVGNIREVWTNEEFI